MLTFGSGKSSSSSSPKTEMESVHLKIPMLSSLFSSQNVPLMLIEI
jgi:hypothetical protein